MNIKIQDELQFKSLMDSVIDTIEFGSGENDKDLLHIVTPNVYMDSAIHNRDHFLFYKDVGRNEDHLFATPRMIVNSLLTGSSDLPYKIYIEGLFNGSLGRLYWLDKKIFMNRRMARCLCGVAARDLKQMRKHDNPNKKMKWIRRYCDYIIEILKYHDIDCDVLVKRVVDKSTINELRYLTSKIEYITLDDQEVRLLNKISFDGQTEIPPSNLEEVSNLYLRNWEESLCQN